jgi:hypothetical protein
MLLNNPYKISFHKHIVIAFARYMLNYIPSITTPWAIPGIELPSFALTGETRAPVGTNRIRFHFTTPCAGKSERYEKKSEQIVNS